ncbi:MAG TPA: hypothetical protein V6C95_14935 [Coleofasciculaceae cyanobacterium]
MALVHERFVLSVTWQDSGNDQMKQSYELQGADIAAATTNAAALIAVLAAASDAKIVGYSIQDVYAENAFTPFVNDTVKVAIQADISVLLAGYANKRASIVIPAPKNAVFQAVTGEGSDIVSATSGLTTGVVNQFKDGAAALISDGEKVANDPFIVGIRRAARRRMA